MDQDGPREFRPLLLYEDVYGQKPTPSSFKTKMGRMNRSHFVNFLSASSAMMHNCRGSALESDWQLAYLNYFSDAPGISRVNSLIVHKNRVLVHELQLGLLFIYAMKYCRDDETVGDFNECALKAMLAFNTLHVDATPRSSETLSAESLDFFRIEIQSAVLNNERFAHAAQRYYRFIKWCDSLSPSSPDWLPLRTDFKRLLGLSPEDYLSSCLSVLAPFFEIELGGTLRAPFFDQVAFYGTLQDRTAVDAYLSIYSQADSDLAASLVEPTFTASDCSGLVDKPLVVLGRRYVYAPILGFVEDTINLRFLELMFNNYERVDGRDAARRFPVMHGRFFESYVHSLMQFIIGEQAYELSGEREYEVPSEGKRLSTDTVMIRKRDGASVFVEVTRSRFSLVKSVFALDEKAVKRDLEAMVIKKAEQIQKTVDHLQDGYFAYTTPVGSIIPIVVTGQGIPGVIYLRGWIQGELASRNLLQKTLPLLYCDVEELELVALMSEGKVDFYDLLWEKANHSESIARLQSLKNYLYYFRTDLSEREYGQVFPEFHSAVEAALSAVKSWGIADGPAFGSQNDA
jgi:hypothetical protein